MMKMVKQLLVDAGKPNAPPGGMAFDIVPDGSSSSAVKMPPSLQARVNARVMKTGASYQCCMCGNLVPKGRECPCLQDREDDEVDSIDAVVDAVKANGAAVEALGDFGRYAPTAFKMEYADGSSETVAVPTPGSGAACQKSDENGGVSKVESKTPESAGVLRRGFRALAGK